MVRRPLVVDVALAAAALLCIPATAGIGAVAGLVLIAAQAVFWIGFLLPAGPPMGLLAAVALVVGLVMGRGVAEGVTA